MAVSRLSTLARLELAPLHAAAQVLPLPPQALQRARWGLVCLPLLLGLVALCVALALAAAAGQVQVHRAVFSAYGLVCLVAGVVEARAEPAAAAAQSSRWLLSLCLGIALASEATG